RQSTFGKRFVAKLLRQFADRFAVAHWNRMHADERFITFFNRRTFNCRTVNRIRPIEHNNVNAAFLARAHAEIECPNESVITRADVLKIDNKRVEIGEHLRRGLTVVAVQAVNRNVQPRMLVSSPFDHVVLGLTEESMLRTEKRAELK